MEQPTAKALQDATGISPSYAHMILSGDRSPARPLAIRIFRKTGWKPPVIAALTPAQIDMLEQIAPWSPRPAKTERAA